jgi:hypothetical protein
MSPRSSCATSRFRRVLESREIGCWVFDEAHCLSKWGHDFRPDYLYAARFIRELADRQGVPVPSVACFTATAKLDVTAEILSHFKSELGLELKRFEGGVGRDNLSFEVRLTRRQEKETRLHEVLVEHLGEPGPNAAGKRGPAPRSSTAPPAGGWKSWRSRWPARAGRSPPSMRDSRPRRSAGSRMRSSPGRYGSSAPPTHSAWGWTRRTCAW